MIKLAQFLHLNISQCFGKSVKIFITTALLFFNTLMVRDFKSMHFKSTFPPNMHSMAIKLLTTKNEKSYL